MDGWQFYYKHYLINSQVFTGKDYGITGLLAHNVWLSLNMIYMADNTGTFQSSTLSQCNGLCFMFRMKL